MNRSTPGLPVHHQLPEFTQTHVHRVSDAIQPSHPLSSPSPPAPKLSQHQSLCQWVNSSREVAKVLELQWIALSPYYFLPGSCTLPHASFLVSVFLPFSHTPADKCLMAPQYLQDPIQPHEQNLYTLRIWCLLHSQPVHSSHPLLHTLPSDPLANSYLPSKFQLNCHLFLKVFTHNNICSRKKSKQDCALGRFIFFSM